MTNGSTAPGEGSRDDGRDSAGEVTLTSLVGDAWDTLNTVYYANSRSWRFLKAGTLVFFGFFLWAGATSSTRTTPN